MGWTARLRVAAAGAVVGILAGCNGDTEAAQDITASSARLTFWGSTSSGDADVHFEYGTTTALGSRTPVQRITGLAPNEVYDSGRSIVGLTPGARYFFRACGKE